MAGTKFSDYLGLNHYKKAKKLKHFIHLRLAYRPQSVGFLCHFQILLAISELQLTLPYVLYVLDVKSAVALKWHI